MIVGPRSSTSTRSLRRQRIVVAMAGTAVLLGSLWWVATHINWNPHYEIGQRVDDLNGVPVFYNGAVAHSAGRNLSPDGYNLGIRYQCVEFVKRYYYEYLNHAMPDSYGHAKHFLDPSVPDGARNPSRNLLQFVNGSTWKPCPDDLLVWGPSPLNQYGHVAIVSDVTSSDVEIIQQNPGPFGATRKRLSLVQEGGRWHFENQRILGWLRKSPDPAEELTADNGLHVRPRSLRGRGY